MGSGQQPLAWIHVKDLAEMIKFSIEDENVSGVLNGVAPQLITNKVRFRIIFKVRGLRRSADVNTPSWFEHCGIH